MEEGKKWTGAPGFNIGKALFYRFLFFFLMWTILKSLLTLVTILLFSYNIDFSYNSVTIF